MFLTLFFSEQAWLHAETAARAVEFLWSSEFKAELDGETVNIQWYFTSTSVPQK